MLELNSELSLLQSYAEQRCSSVCVYVKCVNLRSLPVNGTEVTEKLKSQQKSFVLNFYILSMSGFVSKMFLNKSLSDQYEKK